MKKYVLCDVSAILMLMALCLFGGYLYLEHKREEIQGRLKEVPISIVKKEYSKTSVDRTMFERAVKETTE